MAFEQSDRVVLNQVDGSVLQLQATTTASQQAILQQIAALLAVQKQQATVANQETILSQLAQIIGLLTPPKPTRIALELPIFRRKGKIVPNFELPNDEVLTVTIKTTNQAGATEPVPAGDTFSVVSSNPASLAMAIGTDASGNPAVVFTPMVQASPNITCTVSDSAGLVQAVQLFDIVQDVTPTNIVLDLADATHTVQPVPTNPGP